ncbi:MAG: HDIG domain-containing metalloprotein [Planctomycetota bacterium]
MDHDAAWKIVSEYVKEPGLRRHMLAVECAMRGYAERLGGDARIWCHAGLLHDFDWEIHPSLEAHPKEGAPILRERGVDEEVIRMILSHNTEGTGVEREKPGDFALQACDEITGLITAATLVRPSKDIRDVKVKSIKKKWKDKAFAAGVDRAHVQQATAEFSAKCFQGQLELWEHVENVLASMQGSAEALDLDGRLAAAIG